MYKNTEFFDKKGENMYKNTQKLNIPKPVKEENTYKTLKN